MVQPGHRCIVRFNTGNRIRDPHDLGTRRHQHLKTHDAARTNAYQTTFLSLPLLSTILYAPRLLSPSSPSEFLLVLLAITSLLSTAYILNFVPLDARGAQRDKKRTAEIPGIAKWELGDAATGPLDKYLVYLDAGMGVVLALAGWAGWRRGRDDELIWGFLPGGT